MERIDKSTIKVTDDEDIIGSFYLYLRDERGMTDEQAQQYLRGIPSKIEVALNPEYLAWLTDGEPLAQTSGELGS